MCERSLSHAGRMILTGFTCLSWAVLGGWDNFLMFDSPSFCCFAQAKCFSGLTHSSSSPDFVTAFNLWGWHLSQPDGPVNGILFFLSWHLLARLPIKAFRVGRFGCSACLDCGCPYSPWQSKVFLYFEIFSVCFRGRLVFTLYKLPEIPALPSWYSKILE